jgi:hypothetical protein
MLLFALATWFSAIALLFLGFGWICHLVGDPVRVPEWVVAIARFGGNEFGPLAFLEFLFLAVWIVFVGGVSLVAAVVVRDVNAFAARLFRVEAKRAEHSSDAAFLSMIPLIGICGLTILILPANSPSVGHDGPSMSQVAQYISFPEFLRLMIGGTLAMVAIASIFVSIFAAFAIGGWIEKSDDPSGCFFFLGLVGGI